MLYKQKRVSERPILVLSDHHINIQRKFYDATVSVSTDKKVTVLFCKGND